jgi:branched-subunit amino acid transport protein
MTAVIAMVALAAVCWLFRVTFVVLVPAERLPARVREALGHLAPAVLAAMVAVEADAASRGDGPAIAALVLGSVLVIGVVVHRTRSLVLAIALGAVATLLIDVVVLA